MKTIAAIISMIFLSSATFAQDSSEASNKNSKYQEIKIKTSTQCDMCKERIEEALAFEKGVKKSVVDVEKQIVTVTYKTSKTTPEKIRKAISKVGYDADDVEADSKAYAKLDACCKKPEDPDSEEH